MPRSRRSTRRAQPHVELDLERIVVGGKRTEVKRGAEWHVQPVTAARAVKTYVCPGCGGAVAIGVRHIVVWRADSIFGDRAIEDRRHWHEACWRVD